MSSFWVAEVERVKQFRPWLTLNRDDALILGVRLELKHALWCHGNISTPWSYWGFKSLVFNQKFIFKNELFIFSINVISRKNKGSTETLYAEFTYWFSIHRKLAPSNSYRSCPFGEKKRLFLPLHCLLCGIARAKQNWGDQKVVIWIQLMALIFYG